MKLLKADLQDPEAVEQQMNALIDNGLDITGAKAVDLKVSRGVGTDYVVHVNVNGICVLRVCRAAEVEVDIDNQSLKAPR